jgi:hypothetical protein
MATTFPEHFERQYQSHLKHLKLKGPRPKTIEAYARGMRRRGEYCSYRVDALSQEDLAEYFTDLLGAHSWSGVKLDLYGWKFFTEHVLRKPWAMPNFIRPPKVSRLPDIVSVAEAQALFAATRVLSYRVFFFTLYSLGLRPHQRADGRLRAALGDGAVIALAQLIEPFEPALLQRYGDRLLPSHRQALAAMKRCRTAFAARMLAQCTGCGDQRSVPHSCGHRSCPHCQHHEAQVWIERQMQREGDQRRPAAGPVNHRGHEAQMERGDGHDSRTDVEGSCLHLCRCRIGKRAGVTHDGQQRVPVNAIPMHSAGPGALVSVP